MSIETDKAISDVRDERQRQIDKEGYTARHDDAHSDGSLAMAAALYATPTLLYGYEELADRFQFKDMWPWSAVFDKRPADGNSLLHNEGMNTPERRRQLVMAAALIVAEIERLDRSATP